MEAVMPYLPNFDYDIFISYAHANNDYPKGWVTDFHGALQRMLNASVRGVTIWRDNNLDSNPCFDAGSRSGSRTQQSSSRFTQGPITIPITAGRSCKRFIAR